MRRTGGVLAAVLVMTACGGKPSGGDVRSTLDGFAKAIALHDFQALCDVYLAPKLVDGVEAAGLPCEAALRPQLSATIRPTMTVKSIRVSGATASAEVHATAANQPSSDDTIALVRVDGRWRVASLGKAGAQPTTP